MAFHWKKLCNGNDSEWIGLGIGNFDLKNFLSGKMKELIWNVSLRNIFQLVTKEFNIRAWSLKWLEFQLMMLYFEKFMKLFRNLSIDVVCAERFYERFVGEIQKYTTLLESFWDKKCSIRTRFVDGAFAVLWFKIILFGKETFRWY